MTGEILILDGGDVSTTFAPGGTSPPGESASDLTDLVEVEPFGNEKPLTFVEESGTDASWREAPGSPSRTPLGQRLREIRAQIVASGTPLLTWEEVQREIDDRRGNLE